MDDLLILHHEGVFFLNKLLHNHSMVFLEIDFDQTNKIKDILKFNHLKCVKVAKDIQNLDRVLIVKKS